MADILLLSPCSAAAECLRRAVRGEAAGGVFHALRQAAGWAELTLLARGAAAGLAFVDPYHAGRFAAAVIRRLRQHAPALEVVAYGDFTGRPPADAFTLARLGVREMVCTGCGGESADLARCLREHLNHGPLDDLVRALNGVVPPVVHRWLAPALQSAGPSTVPELARAARCSPRSLRRTARAAGLPSPERILAWSRLLHAARLLDDGRSADSVARTLGFSSGSALRKSLKQRTGLRPAELTAGGGLRLLAARFLEECGTGPAAGARSVAARDTGARQRRA